MSDPGQFLPLSPAGTVCCFQMMAEIYLVNLVPIAGRYEVKPCWTHNLSSVWLLFSLAIFHGVIYLFIYFSSKLCAQRGA